MQDLAAATGRLWLDAAGLQHAVAQSTTMCCDARAGHMLGHWMRLLRFFTPAPTHDKKMVWLSRSGRTLQGQWGLVGVLTRLQAADSRRGCLAGTGREGGPPPHNSSCSTPADPGPLATPSTQAPPELHIKELADVPQRAHGVRRQRPQPHLAHLLGPQRAQQQHQPLHRRNTAEEA